MATAPRHATGGTPPADPSRDPLLNEDATATYLHLSTRTLQRMRVEGDGPQFVRMGERRIAYRLSDLNAWVNARRFASTAEESTRAAKEARA